MLQRMIANLYGRASSLVPRSAAVQGLCAIGGIGLSHQVQQIRGKKRIHFCGFIEPPEFKKKDIRYQTSTAHDTRRMNWQDYQFRKFKAVHFRKQYPLWQSKMDYAENLCRLGMSTWSIQKITGLHPHCIEYINMKLSGQVKLLREAHYSNYVNHKSGDR